MQAGFRRRDVDYFSQFGVGDDEELDYGSFDDSTGEFFDAGSMANLAASTFCPSFTFELGLLDAGLQELLRRHGLDQARRLACLVPKKLAGEPLSERLVVLLDGMGAGAHRELLLPQLLSLLLGARGEAPELAA